MPTRILLADDHALIRQGLKALLENKDFKLSPKPRTDKKHCARRENAP